MPRKSGIPEEVVDQLIEDVAKASIMLEKHRTELFKADDYPYTDVRTGIENALAVITDDALPALGIDNYGQQEHVAGLPQRVVIKNNILTKMGEAQNALDDLFKRLDRTPEAVTKASAVKTLKTAHKLMKVAWKFVTQAINEDEEAKAAAKGKRKKKAKKRKKASAQSEYITVKGELYKLAAGNFDVMVAYERWSDEDKEIGETDDKGVYLEENAPTLEDALQELPSVSWTYWGEQLPNNKSTISFISQPDENLESIEKGIDTTYTAFIRKIDRSPFTDAELEFIGNKLGLLGERPVMASATQPEYIRVDGHVYCLANKHTPKEIAQRALENWWLYEEKMQDMDSVVMGIMREAVDDAADLLAKAENEAEFRSRALELPILEELMQAVTDQSRWKTTPDTLDISKRRVVNLLFHGLNDNFDYDVFSKTSLFGSAEATTKEAAVKHPEYIRVNGHVYRLAAPPEHYQYHTMKDSKWDAGSYKGLKELHSLLEKWDRLSSADESAFSSEVSALEKEINERILSLQDLDWPPMLDELLESYDYDTESADNPATLHTTLHQRTMQEATAAKKGKKKPGWKKLPKGWTQKSAKKFWKSLLTDDGKEKMPKKKVTKCIREVKKMKDKEIDDPGAFCASLADMIEGPEWRKEPRKKRSKKKDTKKKPSKKGKGKKKASTIKYAGFTYEPV